jgi:hypothetical protein
MLRDHAVFSNAEVVEQALRMDPSILDALTDNHVKKLQQGKGGNQRGASRSRVDRSRDTRRPERDERRGLDPQRRTGPICKDFKRGCCWRRNCNFLHIR